MQAFSTTMQALRPGKRVSASSAPQGRPMMLPMQAAVRLTHNERPMISNNSESSRSEEHTSELQSLMRISYAVFCLKKKNKQQNTSQYRSKPQRDNKTKQ